MPIDVLATSGIPSSTDPLDLDAARRDLWPRSTLMMRDGLLPPRPVAVAWPRSAEEVADLLRIARRQGIPVVPYGAGSGVCGGAAGRADALVIDLKRMNKVLGLDTATRSVRVQPGLLGQHLEDWLVRRGFMTAHSPSSIMCSSVGGWVAARSAGQFSSRYGVFDDMLLALAAESPAGQVLAGAWTPDGEEDLLPLLSGSEGTLGIITDAVVRVSPLPDRRWLRGLAFPDLPSAWEAMRRILQAEARPSVLRLYDPIDTRIGGPARAARKEHARQQRPEAGTGRQLLDRLRAAVESVPALREHLLELPLALPRLLNRLAENLADEVLLVVGFEGSTDEVDAALAATAPILAEGRDLGPEPGEHWYQHRHDVSYKLAPVFAGGAWADTMEVAATWSRLPELHDRVRAALGERAVVMAHFSHAYREGCSIYFSFAGRGGVDIYDATWRAGLAAAREAGGTITHHHGVGQLKAAAATREAGAAVRVWQEIRSRLDSTGIMNPGRLFDAAIPHPEGPPRPADPGPVFALDPLDRIAEVDPLADPSAIERALTARGYRLRLPPDRPLASWLAGFRHGVLLPDESPVFAVQARFTDGVSARVGPAPRSAAGPDLRFALLRRATAEMVQVPVVPVDHPVRGPLPPAPFQAPCPSYDPESWTA